MDRAPLEWWMDRANLLVDIRGNVNLGGAVKLDFGLL